MRTTFRRTLLAFLLTIAALSLTAQTAAPHDGDRVAFYGDSITAQRLYTRFVEDFYLTRSPQVQITFVNAGVSGDTVNGGYTGDLQLRLKRDLYPVKPTVVTVMLGMNDGYYVPFEQKYFDFYKEGYRKLLDSIHQNLPSARITLISPTPYDEVTHGTEFAHYNEVITRHAEFVKETAASGNYNFADFSLATSNLLYAGMKKNPSLAPLLITDRIHPSEATHWVMAAVLAKSWGLSPIVSRVDLDAKTSQILATENAQVTQLSSDAHAIRWTEKENSLPLPLQLHDAMIQFVLSISPLVEMDQEILRVRGLNSSHYTLKIDNRKIASFTHDELAAGVNLALYPTPMLDQAKDVDGIEEKRQLFNRALFDLTIETPQTAGSNEAGKVLVVKDAELLEEERRTAQPKEHHFELAAEQ